MSYNICACVSFKCRQWDGTWHMFTEPTSKSLPKQCTSKVATSLSTTRLQRQLQQQKHHLGNMGYWWILMDTKYNKWQRPLMCWPDSMTCLSAWFDLHQLQRCSLLPGIARESETNQCLESGIHATAHCRIAGNRSAQINYITNYIIIQVTCHSSDLHTREIVKIQEFGNNYNSILHTSVNRFASLNRCANVGIKSPL